MTSTSNQTDSSHHFPFSSSSDHWNVFLNFRGPDTRENFTIRLYRALVKAGLRTFMDDSGLQKGEKISPKLLTAIRNSDMSIEVFSKNYASSQWCLDELAEIHKCKRRKEHVVVPVFYDVAPSDVRYQTGSFEKAFERHSRRFGAHNKVMKKWKAALNEAGNLSGYHLQNDANGILRQLGFAILPTSISRNRIEADLIKRIVKNAHDKVQDIFEKSFPAQLTARDLKFPLRSYGWKWSRIQEHKGAKPIEIAEITEIDWVLVHGKYELQNLKEGLKYKVQVKVMLRDNLKFDCPLNLKLTLPDSYPEQRKEDLMKMPRNQWIWLRVGEFKAQNVSSGDVEFSLEAISSFRSRNSLAGLVINSVRFLPTT